ncbi:hypothetical protein BKA70DRAFT_834953 [Coprinopsis sp. MPI-PUGE-AT-0042]|nr:hypothetical protein BKA70DRAFT_834953 [Coprinopsis sp. MPI-PUGE-AT-0042]
MASSAVQASMWLQSYLIFRRFKAEEKRDRTPFMAVSFFILLCSIVSSILGGWSMYNILLDARQGPENSLESFRSAAKILDWLWLKGDLIWSIGIWVSDGMVLYRCYVVHFDRRWLSIAPGCLYISGVAISIRNHIPLLYLDYKSTGGIDTLLLVSMNVLVTGQISARLIIAQRRMTQLAPSAVSSGYLGTAAILVESAAPLALIGVPLAVTIMLIKTNQVAWEVAGVLETMYMAIAILSPQLIMFRVMAGRSWANSRGSSEALTTGLQFEVHSSLPRSADSLEA